VGAGGLTYAKSNQLVHWLQQIDSFLIVARQQVSTILPPARGSVCTYGATRTWMSSAC
jgi:hypothetical protein